jgi:beta-N-acetylhexosaminidase
VLFSDDLEMGAIKARYPIEEAAVESVWAGCDALLICKSEDAQDRAHEALVRKAESDRRFRDRCIEAATRGLKVRRLAPPRPITARSELDAIVGGPLSRAIYEEITLGLAGAGAVNGSGAGRRDPTAGT